MCNWDKDKCCCCSLVLFVLSLLQRLCFSCYVFFYLFNAVRENWRMIWWPLLNNIPTKHFNFILCLVITGCWTIVSPLFILYIYCIFSAENLLFICLWSKCTSKEQLNRTWKMLKFYKFCSVSVCLCYFCSSFELFSLFIYDIWCSLRILQYTLDSCQ